MSKELIKQRFGKYLLLDHLVDGGMAKICRARYLAEDADKVVAIKMVQPQFSQDPSFKQMFLDEIKVTFGLIHPNIAQTYDYGVENDQLYAAMEYVDGKNLKQYLDKLKERKFVFPVEISVFITSQVCQGLHYAHTYTDKLSGKKSVIIHRDISPHNIMLTYDGAIKVIDFGIAKADTNTEATQAGIIKGKLSYLAPEYLEGKQLDPRYDEFAVGITLWELLCSRKLFQANNQMEAIKKIQACKVPPPSSINPNVPKELDQIVMKALAKKREERYQDLDQFNRALIKFLYSTYPDFNSSDLSYFAKELFKEDITEDRKQFYEFGKIDIRPFIDDMKRSSDSVANATSDNDSAEDIKIRSNQVLDFGFEENKTITKKIVSKEKKESTGLQIEATRVRRRPTAPFPSESEGTKPGLSEKTTSTRIPGTRTDKSRSRPMPQGKSKKSTGGGLALLVILVVAVVGAYYSGIIDVKRILGTSALVETKKVEETAKVEQKVPVEEKLSVVSNSESGSARIANIQEFSSKPSVYIDGTKVNVDMIGEFDVPLGKTVSLRVEQKGRKHYVSSLSLNKDYPSEEITVPEMPFQLYGYLATSSSCIVGRMKFSMFGEDRVEELPFKDSRGIAFPVSEETVIVTVDQGNGTVEREVSFRVSNENELVDLCELI